MEVRRALQQISEIQSVLSRAQTYRGYRPMTIGSTAVLAFVATIAQKLWPARDPVALWVSIALVSLAIVSGEMLYDYTFRLEASQKRLAFKVIEQFLPGLAMGAGITVVWCWAYPQLLPMLPGLWAACYSLSLFSARPHLVRGVGWVALFYAVAALMLLTPTGAMLGNWGMGFTFSFGQAFLALVLSWNLARNNA